MLTARAARDPAHLQQEQIVIVATNALPDYDVVNFDLTSCWDGKEGEAALNIYRWAACGSFPGHIFLLHENQNKELLYDRFTGIYCKCSGNYSLR